ncbi:MULTISPECIES: phosphonate C-P lyase system protein PhnG [unclassified Devosia]|uniref:phosphonate C-P lyase system protein PhnG n=2 Tax=unclassified Devosia TaxID=196773 RepID=UPI000714ECF1|nr:MULTISPECIES: phosphonate C-P lyase system protein PhnG [unclassified Devosia]KQN70156.1 phosphonate C-P lyase system protein PhnG [Devosia sp. Leaf64]KQT46151.1 phosphonate C-P lyase system protein PhnG [Devosia sp. Leaf420]
MSEISAEQSARKRALDVLAAAPAKALAERWAAFGDQPAHQRIRGPETGLVMVRGRAGGGGAPFNLGEATVSRASVRIVTGEIGHGYCLGRDLDKAEAIAVIDALRQREMARVDAEIIEPLEALMAAGDEKRAEETAATRVDFFTMVRGDN